jgi:hypothetical protein
MNLFIRGNRQGCAMIDANTEYRARRVIHEL